MGIETAVLTDTGQVRDHNEDSVSVAPTSGGRLLAVADGMGGHNAGEVASAVALETFVAEVGERLADADPETGLSAAALAADEAVREAAADESDRDGMGTTLVAGLVGPEETTVVNVGDSRAYRVDDAAIEQVSVDHSLVQELVDAGEIAPEEAESHRQRNVISQALGVGDAIEPDTFSVDLAAGEVLLCCSDGLTEEVAESTIHDVLTREDSLQSAAEALVSTANRNGGSDNVSVVLGRHGPD
ncbi:MAG: Stp1/IreP family PP2C-type Ser/Thr phosphatase [Haloarculaceae archaeon]